MCSWISQFFSLLISTQKIEAPQIMKEKDEHANQASNDFKAKFRREMKIFAWTQIKHQPQNIGKNDAIIGNNDAIIGNNLLAIMGPFLQRFYWQ